MSALRALIAMAAGISPSREHDRFGLIDGRTEEEEGVW
jgi:hypothetical protein